MAALLPGTYSVTNEGASEMDAFDAWLTEHAGSVRLFEKAGADALMFEPGKEPSEFAIFQVYSPTEWTLSVTPLPVVFDEHGPRPDAVPGPETKSPERGKPEGNPLFGGGLLTLDQLGFLVLLGLYFYSQSKGKR